MVTPEASHCLIVSLTYASSPMMCSACDQLVGDQRGRLVLLPRQVEPLHLVGEVGVAHPVEDVLVEVLLLGAHAAHVERDDRLEEVDHRLRVVGDLEVAGRGDLEGLAGVPRPGPGEALVQPRLVHLGAGRGVEDRDPAVGDLGGLRDVLRSLGAEPDRHVGAQRVDDRLQRLAEPDRVVAVVRQRVVRAVVGDRALAGQHLADDLDDLPGARQRLAEGLAVPPLHHLRARSRPCPGSRAPGRGGRGSARASRSRPGCAPTSARSRCRA